MKKNFRFAFVGAIALLGAVGISSCSSSSDEVINNPNYDPETNTVKAQFAISIPISGGGASTRMDADGAPNNSVFKGMKDIKLYPITTVDATTKIATSTSAISTPNALDPISDFNQKGSGNNSFNGNVYSEVDIPVGTKAFVFYGEITNEKGGDLTPNYATSGTIGNVNFSLVPIQTATFATLSDTDGNLVLAALNGIVAELKSQVDAAAAATHASAPHLTALLQIFQSLKAGSAATVRAFVENVYNQLTDLGTTYDATTYTSAVQGKIGDYFTVSTGGSPHTLSWTSPNTFPSALGLPDGAIGVSCNTSTNTFAFASAIVNGNSQPELNTYVKPASLFYTVNTPIHTSTTAQVTNYATQTSWANVVGLYTQGTEVVANTRAVVLDNPIQYGVARMASQVVLNSTLKANDINGNEVSVTAPASGYPVTGILIGTQKNVDWKFEPTGATSYTIYDPVQTGGAGVKATTTATPVNYTLALQTAVDEEIKVVVEMLNEGDPFYGIENQLIPKNSKFYLIAKLLPSNATNYNASDNTKNKVFCQDVETTVTFTVGETSLKNAYNTIPDLRAAKMELGLSVDLSWKTGLSFGVTLGN